MINFITNYSGVQLLVVSIAYLIAIVFAITIHEYSHSLIALTQGDYTSKYYGRLTLNPLKHIDPIGFICLILFGFGWAKPVPINSVKFKNYKKGLFLTSLAGICANLIFSFLFMGILVLAFPTTSLVTIFSSSSYLLQFLYLLLYFSASINLGLAIFNLIPIPPLDGFNCILSFTKGTNKFINFIKQYGFIILLLLLITNVIDILFAYLYGLILPAFANFWYFIF